MRVLTIGTFDLLHEGHLRLMERAAGLGELTVGVNSDRFVEEYKGRPPVESEQRRLSRVRWQGYRAVLNDGPGRDLIRALAPSLLVVGSDWHNRYLEQIQVTQAEVDEWGIGIVYLPRTPGVSTTALRRS